MSCSLQVAGYIHCAASALPGDCWLPMVMMRSDDSEKLRLQRKCLV